MATKRTTNTKRAERPAEPVLLQAFPDDLLSEGAPRARHSGFSESLDGDYESLPANHEDELPLLVDELPAGEGEEAEEDPHSPDSASTSARWARSRC
jgi:hypothetical protein